MAEEKLCQDHSVRIEKLEQSESDQWTAINKLRERPPVWTTVVLSVLTFLLGFSVGYAGLIMKMSGPGP